MKIFLKGEEFINSRVLNNDTFANQNDNTEINNLKKYEDDAVNEHSDLTLAIHTSSNILTRSQSRNKISGLYKNR